MVTGLGALILRTGKIDEMAKFYKALGLPLEREREADGSAVFTCDLRSQRFAIYETHGGDAPKMNMGGATHIGLDVSSIDKAYDAAVKIGAKIAVEPEPVDYGRRAVLLDPDGRAVEITER